MHGDGNAVSAEDGRVLATAPGLERPLYPGCLLSGVPVRDHRQGIARCRLVMLIPPPAVGRRADHSRRLLS